MDFHELLMVATTNPRLNSIACEEFRRKYNDYAIVIVNATDVPHGVEKFHTFKNDQLVEIYDYNLAVSVFQNFGNEIQKLRIETRGIQADRLSEIIRFAKGFVPASMKHSKFVVKSGTRERSMIPFKDDGEFCVEDQTKVGHI